MLLPLLLSGCATVEAPPQPIDPVVVTASKVAVVEPVQQKKAKPQVKQAPTVVSTPTVLTPQTIAIVLSDRSQAYMDIATELEKWMKGRDYSIFALDEDGANTKSIISQIRARNSTAVVAVGLRAARTVSPELSLPVVFCQVFNYSTSELLSERVKGVGTIPPLEQQLALWLRVNPRLKSVGAIVGDGHDALLEEARRTVSDQGVAFEHHIATTNMETLYLFKRMANKIDGFWLFPDNRILSRGVIRDILTYSIKHGVQVTVFTPALLRQGAYMSATGTEKDVALKILSILDQISVDRFDQVPPITPLSEMQVHWNTWLQTTPNLEASQSVD